MNFIRTRPALVAIVGLALVCFTGNFLYLSDFGLYEDDYGIVLHPATRSLSTELSMVGATLKSPPQGRPILWTLSNVGTNLLWQGGSLSVLYVFVAALTTLNAAILFVFLRRHVSPTIAFAACVFFLLYPPDTSKQQLMHWSSHLICCSVVLASLHLHLHGRPFLSWFLPSIGAVFCLLCYEPYFLLFFAFPFFKTYEQSFLRFRPFLYWIAFLLAVFVLGMWWRHSAGEGRVMDLSANLSKYLERAATAPVHGAVTVIRSMWERPWDVVKHATVDLWLIGALVFVPAYLTVRVALSDAACGDAPATDAEEAEKRRRWALQFLAIAGLIAFVLSYPYRFIDDYFPPNVNMGRFSGMHAIGTFGFCVFLAAQAQVVGSALQTRMRWLAAVNVAVAAYLLLLFVFSVRFQQDQYVRSWAQQRELWRDIAVLSPDMAAVDVVLLDTRGMQDPSGALSHTEAFPFYQWNHQTTTVLPYFFKVGSGSRFPKLVHFGTAANSHVGEGGEVRLSSNAWRPKSFWPEIRDQSFIRLRYEGGRWRRVQDPLEISGLSFTPKEAPAPGELPPLEFTKLGTNVLAPELRGEHRWDYQRFGRFYPKK